MAKIGIYYGTSTGNTQDVAEAIAKKLGVEKADLHDVAKAKADYSAYDVVLFGTSTLGLGDLQDDWDSFLPTFSKADLSDKTVAIFALGDSASFSSSFAEAMKVIYDAIKDKTKVVGFVDDEGYTYDDSTAVVDGRWVGLPIDEDNEYDQTDARLEAWVEELKKEFI